MSSLQVLHQPTERQRYFDDGDAVATSKREAEVLTLIVDWSAALATGEVIASVSYADSGVTTSSASNTVSTSTVTVTGVGETEITATLGSGRKLVKVVRFYDSQGCGPSDYE